VAIDYIFLCLVGRVCIFLLQKFPFTKLPLIGRLWGEGGFLCDLFSCDLCIGVWVYTVLGYFFKINLLFIYFYVPVISEFITGGITSLIVFLVVRGYQAQYSIIKVG
jgi:hypothetical protein